MSRNRRRSRIRLLMMIISRNRYLSRASMFGYLICRRRNRYLICGNITGYLNIRRNNRFQNNRSSYRVRSYGNIIRYLIYGSKSRDLIISRNRY